VNGAGTVHAIVPDGIDDPRRVSGGNVYDRRVLDGLRDGGAVEESRVPPGAGAALDAALGRAPDDAVVLVDGLVASRSPAVVEAHAQRVRLVVLAHMVAATLGSHGAEAARGERRALAAATEVIATSDWTRTELVRRGLAESTRVAVAVPGSDPAAPSESWTVPDEVPSAGVAAGGSLLAVGAVAPHKGQDVLVDALDGLDDLAGWACTLAGPTPDIRFSRMIAGAAARMPGRIRVAGVLAGPTLDAAYRRADLLVSASRGESYGMAIADALRRGIPVIATAVGGVAEAVRPSGAAILVPPDDPGALRAALRGWLTDPTLRARLRARARAHRDRMPTWADTVAAVADALAEVGAREAVA
jgi:glycosyltransferase involved in cell wall biosynthesis